MPKEYSEVLELSSNHKSGISAPVCTVNLPSYMDTLSSFTESIYFEHEWLNNESWCEWAKHHFSFQIFGTEIDVVVNPILPMINKEVHRLDKMYHVMNLNKKITNFLNSSQTPADTSASVCLDKNNLMDVSETFFQEHFSPFLVVHILNSLHWLDIVRSSKVVLWRRYYPQTTFLLLEHQL